MLCVIAVYFFTADACGCSGLENWSSGNGRCIVFGDTSSSESSCCTRGGCPVDEGSEDSCRLCGALHDLSSCTSCSSSSPCLPGYGNKDCDAWVGTTSVPVPPTNPPATPIPDTVVPSTPPDTQPPSTLPPYTDAPYTLPPDTQPPSTQPPNTNAPVTLPPETHSPDTQPPKTLPPYTDAPNTLPPYTQPPSTQPPDTNAPVTLSPETLSPDTQPPSTQPPDTDAPRTQSPAPDTQLPSTLIPDTQSPSTQPPDTQPPSTQIPTSPATSAPSTGAPDTSSPTTPAPVTLPSTAAPDTPLPLPGTTSAPSTLAPSTLGPDTRPPATSAPDTFIPSTSSTVIPSTPIPLTSAPSSLVPATRAPNTLPLTRSPDTRSPPTQAPDTVVSSTQAPATLPPNTLSPGATGAPDTAAPSTQVPVTLAPDTASPYTVVPSTQAPATLVPLPGTTGAPRAPAPPTSPPRTSVPVTNVPSTGTPATKAPGTTTSPYTLPPTTPPNTSAPSTTAPVTLSPETSSPPTAVPVTLLPATSEVPTTFLITSIPTLPTAPLERSVQVPLEPAQPENHVIINVDTVKVLGAIGTVGGILGGGGAASSAGVLVMVSSGCNLNGRKDLPWLLHPTQMELFGSEDAGVVVGNTAIMVGFAFVCYLVLRTVHALGQRRGGKLGLFAALDTQGLLRLPSSPLLVFQVFFLGTCYGATGLLVGAPSIPGFLLGLVSGAGCVGVPVTMFFVARRGVPADALYVACHSRCVVERIFLGEGEWVSRHPERHWVQRYSSVMRTYRQEVAWFWLFEAMAALALSGIYAVHPENYTGCGHVCVFSSCVFMFMMVIEGAVWPHARPRDSVYGFVSNGLQGAATILMGIGYYTHNLNHWAFSTAGSLLLVGLISVVLKSILDIGSELYVFSTGQRAKMQLEFWGSVTDEPEEITLYEPQAGISILQTPDATTPLRTPTSSLVSFASPAPAKSRPTARRYCKI